MGKKRKENNGGVIQKIGGKKEDNEGGKTKNREDGKKSNIDPKLQI